MEDESKNNQLFYGSHTLCIYSSILIKWKLLIAFVMWKNPFFSLFELLNKELQFERIWIFIDSDFTCGINTEAWPQAGIPWLFREAHEFSINLIWVLIMFPFPRKDTRKYSAGQVVHEGTWKRISCHRSLSYNVRERNGSKEGRDKGQNRTPPKKLYSGWSSSSPSRLCQMQWKNAINYWAKFLLRQNSMIAMNHKISPANHDLSFLCKPAEMSRRRSQRYGDWHPARWRRSALRI